MIGWLEGVLLSKKAPQLILNVNGLGYEVTAPMTTIFSLPAVGEKLSLYIHQQVREDGQFLFGFASEGQKTLFRTLIRINGVGPKMALAILSTMSAQELAAHVQAANIAAMTAIPGVGKKTAERLIVELRDKLAAIGVESPAGNGGLGTPVSDNKADAIAALEALGYKNNEATRAVGVLYKADMGSEELIRLALQGMAKK